MKRKRFRGRVGGVVQRHAGRANGFKTIADSILSGIPGPFVARTVAVSNNKYAITPACDLGTKSGKTYAPGEYGLTKEENHSERKLIRKDAGLTEIGVSNAVCPTCKPAIKAVPTIEHVADPDGTHEVATW